MCLNWIPSLDHHMHTLHQHKSMGSSTFVKKVCSLILFFLFTLLVVSPNVASNEEADALLTWKASLPKEAQSQLSSWTLLPNNATNSSTNFNSSNNPPCSWFGIYCNHVESVIGINLTCLGPERFTAWIFILVFPYSWICWSQRELTLWNHPTSDQLPLQSHLSWSLHHSILGENPTRNWPAEKPWGLALV